MWRVVVVLGIASAGCPSVQPREDLPPPSADGMYHCPPLAPWPKKSHQQVGPGNKKDWLFEHYDDGKGHDFEMWCIDDTPVDATPEQIADPGFYHFAYRLSHPTGPSTWFGACIFNRGQNEGETLDKDDTHGWTHLRWKNWDPKEVPDYPRFNDIHYDYSWLSKKFTIDVTQNGTIIKSTELTPSEDEKKFQEDLQRAIKELTGLDPHQGESCTTVARSP